MNNFLPNAPQDEDGPHWVGFAVCRVCRFKYVCVAPEGTNSDMECPNCHFSASDYDSEISDEGLRELSDNKRE